MPCVRPGPFLPVVDKAVLAASRAEQVLARDDPSVWPVVPGAWATVELVRACGGIPISVEHQDAVAATGGDHPVEGMLHLRQRVVLVQITIRLLDHEAGLGNSASTLQCWEGSFLCVVCSLC